MKNKRHMSGTAVSVAAVLFAVISLAAPSVTIAQKAEPPQETHDGLVLVPDRKVASAYVDPEADFSIYKKIMILDCYVAFRKDWQRDQRRTKSTSRHVSAQDMDKIKADVAELFREVFEERLSKDGGYQIVETAGNDVLLVRPAIIDLDIEVPDPMSAGRSRVYTISSAIMSRALRSPSLVAAITRSWSMSVSPDLIASGSSFTAMTCIAPLTVTVTIPPPAVPSTVFVAASS